MFKNNYSAICKTLVKCDVPCMKICKTHGTTINAVGTVLLFVCLFIFGLFVVVSFVVGFWGVFWLVCLLFFLNLSV